MDLSERLQQALVQSHAMLEAARRGEWDDAVNLGNLLAASMSDGQGGWLAGWAESEAPDVYNILLNLREALELMQHRREDLRSLLGDVRNQQRLQASYGNV